MAHKFSIKPIILAVLQVFAMINNLNCFSFIIALILSQKDRYCLAHIFTVEHDGWKFAGMKEGQIISWHSLVTEVEL